MKLIHHPQYPSHQHLSLTADISFSDNHINILYNVIGDTQDIILNSTDDNPMFRDELWKMTCFEMFVQKDDGPGYYEFNFAPCGDWAAYHFDAYREGMKPSKITAPCIILEKSDQQISLEVNLEREALPAGNLSIGLFAMLFTDKDRSFWALHHSESTPNFHQKDCFLYQVTAR